MVEPGVRGSPGWRLLRRLFPADYREQWSDEVLGTHVDAAGGEVNARGVRFWRGLAVDAVKTAVALRLDTVSGTHTLRRSRRGMIDAVLYTVRLATRGLLRTPGFSLSVVVTLALGLGANVTIFTALDRLLLEPPQHVVEPESVRRIAVYGVNPFSRQRTWNRAMTYPDYRDLQTVQGFSSVAAHTARTLTMGRGEESERINTEWATSSWFTLLGVQPALGRFYDASEDQVGVEPVTVLSWAFWKRRFNGDPGILGTALPIGKGVYTVIGVAPRSFTGVDIAPVDAWLPLHTAGGLQQGGDWENARSWYWFTTIVRLRDPATAAAAEAEATAVYRNGRKDVRGADPDARIVATQLIAARGPQPSGEARVTQLLGGVALLVLLIACANVANLFLARGLQRRRALAVQSALGVGRFRLVGQLLSEAVLLAAAAGALAFVVAALVGPALFRALLGDDAMLAAGTGRVFAFTVVLALLTVLLGGVGPALQAARVDPFEALRTQRSSARSSWLRGALVAVQAALSVILLIGAGLFLRSLGQAHRIDLGVDLNAYVIDLELNNGTTFGEEMAGTTYSVVDRVRAHPAVASAALTNLAPFSGAWGLSLDRPGPDSIHVGQRGPFYHAADQDYFRTLGMTITHGRNLTAADAHPGALPVVVVSRSMAREIWGSESGALDQCLIVSPSDENTTCTTVVGVVSDVRAQVTDPEPRMLYYLATRHPNVESDGGQVIMMRLREGMEAQLGSVLQTVRSTVTDIRYVDANPLRDSIDAQMRAWQLGAVLLSAFGLLALMVAGSGLYSVLAFDVAQRRFELGIRSALGASARRLIRTVVTRTLLVIVAGMIIGVAGAAGLSRLIASLLFNIEPVDPLAYVAAMAVLAAGALVAAGVPAWRATRVDPRTAMAVE
jgi:predicted permease